MPLPSPTPVDQDAVSPIYDAAPPVGAAAYLEVEIYYAPPITDVLSMTVEPNVYQASAVE